VSELRHQRHEPMRYSAIRGPYRLSIQLEAPTVVWGADAQFQAFLHQFDDESVLRIIDDYRQATYARRGASAAPLNNCRGDL